MSDEFKKEMLIFIVIGAVVIISVLVVIASYPDLYTPHMSNGGLIAGVMVLVAGVIYFKFIKDSSIDKKNKRAIIVGFLTISILMVTFSIIPVALSKTWKHNTHKDITDISVSSNGSNYIIASVDGIYSYDSSFQQLIWENESIGAISYAKLAPNGNYLIAGTTTIYLLDLASGKYISSYDLSATITTLSISSNGSYYAVGTDNGRLHLFEITNGNPLWTYVSSDPTSIAMSSDGYYIAAGIGSNIRLFNRLSNVPIWSFSASSTINKVSITDDGNKIVGGGLDKNVYFFDKSSNTPLWTKTTEGEVFEVKVSRSGDKVVAITDADLDEKIIILDSSTSNEIASRTMWDRYRTAAISPDCDLIAVGVSYSTSQTDRGGGSVVYVSLKDAGRLELYDQNLQTIRTYDTSTYIDNIEISGDANYILSCSHPPEVWEPYETYFIDYSTLARVDLFMIFIGGCLIAALSLPLLPYMIPKIMENRSKKSSSDSSNVIIKKGPTCPNCGTMLHKNSKYCYKCGLSKLEI